MDKLASTRKSTAIIVVILLLISLVGMQGVRVADANPVPIQWLKIFSPVSSTIYNGTMVALEICKGNNGVLNPVTKFTYSLDSAPYKDITNLTKSSEYYFGGYPVADYTGRIVLENLEIGNHTLNVYSYAKYYGGGRAANVEFEVAIRTANSPNQTPTPTPTPTVPEFPAWQFCLCFSL